LLLFSFSVVGISYGYVRDLTKLPIFASAWKLGLVSKFFDEMDDDGSE
jgi:hypothetical protein